MNLDDMRQKMKAQAEQPPDPPLEATRKFLRTYCSDADGPQEVRDELAQSVARDPRTVLPGLAGIEALLADPPSAGTLSRLLAWEGNLVLEDPSDEGATAWLRETARYIRELLDDDEPGPDCSSRSAPE